jgi:hypothetical protein
MMVFLKHTLLVFLLNIMCTDYRLNLQNTLNSVSEFYGFAFT